jgi:hypothetical protein
MLENTMVETYRHATASKLPLQYAMDESIGDKILRICKAIHAESMPVINNLAWGSTQAGFLLDDPMSS